LGIKEFFLNRKVRKLEQINSSLENKLRGELILEEEKRHYDFLKTIKLSVDSQKLKNLSKKTPKIQKIKNLFKRGTKFLIQMHMENAQVFTFTIKAKEKFTWRKGVYVIDENCKRWNANCKLFELHYHERCSIPFSIEFSHTETKNKLKEIESVDLAVNPETLEIYIHSQFIQKIMQGADMEKLFGFLKIAAVITILEGIITIGLLIKIVAG
jgi:hypothetical protein